MIKKLRQNYIHHTISLTFYMRVSVPDMGESNQAFAIDVTLCGSTKAESHFIEEL